MKHGLSFSLLTLLILVALGCNKLKVNPVNPNGWDELGAMNADSGIIPIAADHNGYIYAAGHFTGAASEYHVEKWNGISWGELGTLNAHAYISCLAANVNTHVFASVEATGTDSGYIAEWDGSNWSKLTDTASGKTVGGHVGTLVAADKLYAVVNNNEIEQWDGGTWTNITAADTLFTNGNIYALTADLFNDLYVGITAAGPGAHPGVAVYGSGSWHLVGKLNPNNKILTLTTDIYGNMYAAGSFTNSTGKTYVAKWDGTKWAEMGAPDVLKGTSDIRCIATDVNRNVFAAGYMKDDAGNYYAVRWNGNTWAKINTTVPMNAPILSITFGKNNNLYTMNYNSSSKKVYLALLGL